MSSNGKICAGCGKDVSRQKQHTDPATQQSYCEPCWQKRAPPAPRAAGGAGSVAGKSRAAATAVLPAEATPQPAPETTEEAGEYEPAGERMPPPRVSYPVTAPPKWVLVAAACWVVLVV